MIAARIIPALVTLASDPEMTVRIATVPAFGTIMETVTDRMVSPTKRTLTLTI